MSVCGCQKLFGKPHVPPRAARRFWHIFPNRKNSEASERYFALQEIQAMGFLHVWVRASPKYVWIYSRPICFEKIMRFHAHGPFVPMKSSMYQWSVPENPLAVFKQVSFFTQQKCLKNGGLPCFCFSAWSINWTTETHKRYNSSRRITTYQFCSMRDGNEETTGDINSCTFKK